MVNLVDGNSCFLDDVVSVFEIIFCEIEREISLYVFCSWVET